MGKANVEISLALLKYARYARGGRIIDPAILLDSNLDRKPQLIDPEIVIKGAAEAPKPPPPCAACTPSNRNSKSCAGR